MNGPPKLAEYSDGSQRRFIDRLRSELKSKEDALEDALDRLAVLERVDRLNPKPPKWMLKKRPKVSEAIVVAVLSDCHWDEIVRPEDVAGVNAYDRTVATERLKCWAHRLAELPKVGPTSEIAGLVVLWGGDMMTGPIDVAHLQDAADTMFGSLLYWSEQAAAAFTLLANAYGSVHVPCVVGNHGRMTMKKRSHLKARDNLDWHLAHLVARLCADDPRITFAIDEASDAEFEIYGRRYLLTHGDQVRGGGGIGGIWPPVMRMTARKQQRQAGLGRPFEHLFLGHWHQYTSGQAFTVNGSMVGYSGFSAECNFPVEPAQQAVVYVTRNGLGWRTAISCEV